jgi:hypothetical protein
MLTEKEVRDDKNKIDNKQVESSCTETDAIYLVQLNSLPERK